MVSIFDQQNIPGDEREELQTGSKNNSFHRAKNKPCFFCGKYSITIKNTTVGLIKYY